MKSTPLGYLFTFLAFSVFAVQDGLSKHLGETHSPVQVAMVRYWAFVAFALMSRFESVEQYASTADKREGEVAGAERRKPVWTGR